MTNVLDARLGLSVTNTSYGYDRAGSLQRISYPNGLTNLYQYDTLDRLTNLAWKVSVAAPGGVRLPNRPRRQPDQPDRERCGIRVQPELRLEIRSALPPHEREHHRHQPNRWRRLRLRLRRQPDQPFSRTFVATEQYVVWDERLGFSPIPTIPTALRSGSGSDTFTYDVENRINSAIVGGVASIAVIYNGDGTRVFKTTNGQTTKYLDAEQIRRVTPRCSKNWTAQAQ